MMLRALVLLAGAGTALAQFPTTFTSPSGFGRMMYPGTGGPTAAGGILSAPVGGAGFGRMLYPGTGGPAYTPQLGPVFMGPAPRAFPAGRGRGVSSRVGGYGYGGLYGSGILPVPIVIGAPVADTYNAPNQQQFIEPSDSPRQPVIILNQNFQPEALNSRPVAPLPNPNFRPASEEQPTIYEIAFRDQSIAEAIGYWVQGNTLNYLTLEGSINQASLDLVDRERTQKLNDDRKVEFRLPKR